eukprot:Opistho-2@18780
MLCLWKRCRESIEGAVRAPSDAYDCAMDRLDVVFVEACRESIDGAVLAPSDRTTVPLRAGCGVCGSVSWCVEVLFMRRWMHTCTSWMWCLWKRVVMRLISAVLAPSDAYVHELDVLSCSVCGSAS